MESIKKTPLLKISPHTIEEVRKTLNLNQDEIKKMLDSFEDWIIKQNHFTTREFNRHYLETSIVNAKGSLERAKTTLDKLCTLKTLLPNFFMKHDVKKEFTDINRFSVHGTVPRLSNDNYRLYINKIVSNDFDSDGMLDLHRFTILMSEYVKIHDYSLGFIIVIDCRDVNLINFVTKFNVVDLRNSISVLMEGYGLRTKGIHIISSSKAVDVFVSMLKQIVSAKIAGRIKVHQTVESVYEHVPREILPKDFGGEEKSLKEINENWINVLSEEENVAFFREISKARTDEKYRLTASYNDQILGMPGSFRTLTVD